MLLRETVINYYNVGKNNGINEYLMLVNLNLFFLHHALTRTAGCKALFIESVESVESNRGI